MSSQITAHLSLGLQNSSDSAQIPLKMTEQLRGISPSPSFWRLSVTGGGLWMWTSPEWSWMKPGAALRLLWQLHSFLAVWQLAQEQGAQLLSEKLHRNQALAELSKEHFLRQGPQRSLSRFLTDPWGRDLTAGSTGGTIQQNSTVLYRAGRLDPVRDRAHKQGNTTEGSPLWQGEEHLTALEGRDMLQLDSVSWCKGGSILGCRRSGSGTCDAWSSMWGLQFASLTLGSPFHTTKEQNVLSHKGLFAVLLKAFGTESIKYPS